MARSSQHGQIPQLGDVGSSHDRADLDNSRHDLLNTSSNQANNGSSSQIATASRTETSGTRNANSTLDQWANVHDTEALSVLKSLRDFYILGILFGLASFSTMHFGVTYYVSIACLLAYHAILIIQKVCAMGRDETLRFSRVCHEIIEIMCLVVIEVM
jgi:hypothetical protein